MARPKEWIFLKTCFLRGDADLNSVCAILWFRNSLVWRFLYDDYDDDDDNNTKDDNNKDNQYKEDQNKENHNNNYRQRKP